MVACCCIFAICVVLGCSRYGTRALKTVFYLSKKIYGSRALSIALWRGYKKKYDFYDAVVFGNWDELICVGMSFE